jgi:hypothetical protein
MRHLVFTVAVAIVCTSAAIVAPWSNSFAAGPLDPRGQIHIPIGIPNTLDTLKTFVEAEGNFSPGFGTYGIYFWLYDPSSGQFIAPTAPGAEHERGLGKNGALIPWTRWGGGDIALTSSVCQVAHKWEGKPLHIAAAQVEITSTAKTPREVQLYVALRPLGAAGGPVLKIALNDKRDAILVDGRLALWAERAPTSIGVSVEDDVAEYALRGSIPEDFGVGSSGGGCSGLMRYDLRLPAEGAYELGFICPVLPGRRATAHQWDGKSPWAQLDEAAINPKTGGQLQPDPGIEYYRKLKSAQLFDQAEADWEALLGRAQIGVPDERWGDAFGAIVGHVAMAMNEGAPDVAVINYNVFNRDGVYVANILQKSGNKDLAEQCLDYFLRHPFNGRVQPEADNPGQILWAIGEHWKLTRDREWLKRVYPQAMKLADMIAYYRTQPEPHWVADNSLEFGDALNLKQRKQLKPGACDGYHPEYTEAFDIAGIRAAAALSEAVADEEELKQWTTLAAKLFDQYHRRFGERLPEEYGSYSVLWPCRVYPLRQGAAFEQFKNVAAKKPEGWRYFPLATAHQGLLTSNRAAGYKTIAAHLALEPMRGWYLLDEGGKSGPGNWSKARTNWNKDVAMPHGWAIAELWLLLRDSLAHEDGDKLILLAGVDPQWFNDARGMAVRNLPTHFGSLSFSYRPKDGRGELSFDGAASPPGGFVLALPKAPLRVEADGKAVVPGPDGRVVVPAGTKRVAIEMTQLVKKPAEERK